MPLIGMSTSGGNPSRAYLTETTSVPTKKAASSIDTSARAALPLALVPLGPFPVQRSVGSIGAIGGVLRIRAMLPPRTSQNSVNAKFAESFFHVLR